MSAQPAKKATAYDKYVNWKLFIIPVILLTVIMAMPTPYGMKDVAVEYKVGPKAVVKYFTQTLFNQAPNEAEQWQLLTAQIMEKKIDMGSLGKERFMKADGKWCKKYKIPADAKNLEKALAFVDQNYTDEVFLDIMQKGLKLKKTISNTKI